MHSQLRKTFILIRGILIFPSIYLKIRTSKRIKLNLGSGVDYRKKYVNVDRSIKFKVDLLCSVNRGLKLCRNESVDEIILSHVINYMYPWELETTLSLCRKKLKKSGFLIIENPDLEKVVNYLQNSQPVSESFFESVRAIFGFGIDEIRNKKKYFPYRIGYRKQDLVHIANQLNFSCKLEAPKIHNAIYKRDLRLILRKR